MSKVDIPLDEIVSDVKKFSDAILSDLAQETLEAIKTHSQSAFNDHSGTLRKSIKAWKSSSEEGVYIVGATAPHAHLIEKGHDIKTKKGGEVVGHVAARPFVQPGADKARAKLSKIVQANVDKLTIEVKP